jgi:serine/threonine-protein kinase RsbW
MASPPDMAQMAQMATVELSFTPLPAHVRTARLVATAVARRSGVEESLLDEVRLAVGEACSRAVEAHRLHCPGEPVRIQLSDRDGRFEVVVSDAVPGAVVDAAAMRAAVGDSAPAPAEHAAAVARIAAAQPQQEPAGTQPGQLPPAAGSADAAGTADMTANGGLPADIGLAVIAGLADDVDISATGGGVSIRMSWPTA